MPWKLDETQVEAARQALGLRYPLYITRISSHTTAGSYYGLRQTTRHGKRLAGPHHLIALTQDSLASRLNRTLLHEMTHAQQCERFLRTPQEIAADPEAVYHTAHEDADYRYFARCREDKRASRVLSRSASRTDAGHQRYLELAHEAEAREVAERLAPSFSCVIGVEATYMARMEFGKRGERNWRSELHTVTTEMSRRDCLAALKRMYPDARYVSLLAPLRPRRRKTKRGPRLPRSY